MRNVKTVEVKPIRKNLLLNPGSDRDMKFIRGAGEFSSDGDAVRQALSFTADVIEWQLKGYEITCSNPENGKIIHFPRIAIAKRAMAEASE